MKKHEVTDKFVREAYNDACPSYKEKIKENIPTFKPEAELEVGKWYKFTYPINDGFSTGRALFCLTAIKDKASFGYGFYNGKWFNYTGKKFATCAANSYYYNKMKEATHEEIQAALIKEAKRRGFEKGVEFKSIVSSRCVGIVSRSAFKYEPGFNFMSVVSENSVDIIFNDGKWAEIISEPKEEEPWWKKPMRELSEKHEERLKEECFNLGRNKGAEDAYIGLVRNLLKEEEKIQEIVRRVVKELKNDR